MDQDKDKSITGDHYSGSTKNKFRKINAGQRKDNSKAKHLKDNNKLKSKE
jgi:hypothetical protein